MNQTRLKKYAKLAVYTGVHLAEGLHLILHSIDNDSYVFPNTDHDNKPKPHVHRLHRLLQRSYG